MRSILTEDSNEPTQTATLNEHTVTRQARAPTESVIYTVTRCLVQWTRTMQSDLSGLRRSQSVWIADEFQEFTKHCLSNDLIGFDIRCDAMWLFLFIGELLPLHEYVHQLKGSLIIRDTYLLSKGILTTRFESGAVHNHLRSMMLAVLTTFFPACLLDCLKLWRGHVAFLLFCLPAHHGHLANRNQPKHK